MRGSSDPQEAGAGTLYCDPLTAYRSDLERVGDVVQFGATDDKWLRRAVRIERLAACALRTRSEVRRVSSMSSLSQAGILGVAERIEAAGALLLAFSLLDSARRLWDIVAPAAACAALLRQARIGRTLGRWDVAERLYNALVRRSAACGTPDLAGQAYLGLGSMYYHTGKLSASRLSFRRARALADRSLTTTSASYHGEMAVALAQGDLNAALVSGVEALETRALRRPDEVGVLVNIAAIAIRSGDAADAIRLLARARTLTRHGRLRMHILGKTALAAAALGRVAAVDRAASGIIREAARVNFPADELEARSELAQAYLDVGETPKAFRIARSVRARAVRLDLGVVVQRCDAILRLPHVASPPLRLRTYSRRHLLSIGPLLEAR